MTLPKIAPIKEFVIFLDLLAQVINANKDFSASDISDGERLWDAHALANKFSDHAFTVLHLCHGTKAQDIPSFSFAYLDSASIDVLTRASMEAFLVFHYVFFAPTVQDEKDLRYWSYKVAGLIERQGLPETIFEHKQQKTEKKKQIDDFHAKINSNTIFQSLSKNHKKQILRGQWRLLSWHDIAIAAGLSNMLASCIYEQLCGYAHSSSLSVLQTQQATLSRQTEQLVSSSIYTMNITIANMIWIYCRLLPKAQDVLEKSGAINFVEIWIKVGREVGENLNLVQETEEHD